jgi:hypothetical protein
MGHHQPAPEPSDSSSPKRKSLSKPVPRAARIAIHIAPRITLALERIPNLTSRDRALLTVQTLQRMSEPRLFLQSVGVPLASRMLGRSVVLAVDALVKARGTPPELWLGDMKSICRDFCQWQAEMLAIADMVIAGNTGSLSKREGTVFCGWYSICKDLGIPRDWPQFERAAKNVCRELDLPYSPEDGIQMLHLHRHLTKDSPGDVFISRDGRMILGERQLRYRYAKAAGVKRKRGDRPRFFESKEDADEAWVHEDFDAPGPAEVAQQMEALEILRRIRDAADRRLPSAKRDSHRFNALDNFESLILGASVRELAVRLGVSRSALSEAFRLEKEAVFREAGISPEN